jgi:hypothetical protein
MTNLFALFTELPVHRTKFYAGNPAIFFNLKPTVPVPSNSTTFVFGNDYMFRAKKIIMVPQL